MIPFIAFRSVCEQTFSMEVKEPQVSYHLLCQGSSVCSSLYSFSEVPLTESFPMDYLKNLDYLKSLRFPLK